MSFRRLLAAAPIATAVGLVAAATASAHIDPDPTEAQAGSVVSVGFTVEHGCDGSPTVQLDMRLPEGVTNASPEPIDGWNGSITDNIVTFIGGPLPNDQAMTFRVSVTLPPTPDTEIYFPFVQRCEEGEIRWIQVPTSDGSSDELGQPAPAMQLFGPAVTSPPGTTPASTTSTSATPQVTASEEPTTTTPPTSTSTVPPTTLPPFPTTDVGEATPTVPDTTSDIDATAGDEGGGSTGTIVFVAAILAVGVVAALAVTQARRRR